MSKATQPKPKTKKEEKAPAPPTNPVQHIRQQRVFTALREEIKRIEKECEKGEKVVISTFGLIVEDVTLASGELVIIRGRDNEGAPISCVQHLEQLSLVVSKRKVDSDDKPVRQIGFRERFWDEDDD